MSKVGEFSELLSHTLAATVRSAVTTKQQQQQQQHSPCFQMHSNAGILNFRFVGSTEMSFDNPDVTRFAWSTFRGWRTVLLLCTVQEAMSGDEECR